METKQDYSYGVIPVIYLKEEWRVFILHQISYRSSDDVYWTFPKGHPEGDETYEETALRELSEESGIELEYLDTARTFDQSYTFTHKDTLIEKSVSYFVGFAENTDFTIQPEEVAEGRWCTFTEAREQLSHDIAKELLDEVYLYLPKN